MEQSDGNLKATVEAYLWEASLINKIKLRHSRIHCNELFSVEEIAETRIQ